MVGKVKAFVRGSVVPLLRRRIDGFWTLSRHRCADSSIPFMLFSLTVSGLIAMKHEGNIERLRNGTETKIGQKKT
jgi:glycerol-3-phosphate acyltransferase PlsY